MLMLKSLCRVVPCLLVVSFLTGCNLKDWKRRSAQGAAAQRVIDGHVEEGDEELLDQAFRPAWKIRQIKGKALLNECDNKEVQYLFARIKSLINKDAKVIPTPDCVVDREYRARNEAEARRTKATQEAAKKAEERRKQGAADAENKRRNKWQDRVIGEAVEAVHDREEAVKRAEEGKPTPKDLKDLAGIYPNVLEAALLRTKPCLTDCQRRRLELETKMIKRFLAGDDDQFQTVGAEVPTEYGTVYLGISSQSDEDIDSLPECGPSETCLGEVVSK